MIRAEADRRCAAAQAPYVVLVVPLLVESGATAIASSGWQWWIARKRCRRRASWRAADFLPKSARTIMAAQVDRKARLAVADDVIDNGGDLAALAPRIEVLHRRYLEMAAVS
jgi:dephospho-CoA kinase